MQTGAKTVKEDHSCHLQSQDKTVEARQEKSLKSYIVGGLAAFIACLCCSLPLIPLMLGLSGAVAFKDQLGSYHWAFDVLGVAVLLGACCYMWRDHRKSGKPVHSFVLVAVTTLLMYAAMTFVMKQVVAPILLGTSAHAALHNNH